MEDMFQPTAIEEWWMGVGGSGEKTAWGLLEEISLYIHEGEHHNLLRILGFQICNVHSFIMFFN